MEQVFFREFSRDFFNAQYLFFDFYGRFKSGKKGEDLTVVVKFKKERI